MIRIMLVDDQRFARLGFQLMLDDASDIVVTAQSADGRSAIETLEQLAVQHRPLPNVILMDVRMPGMDGIQVLTKLREKGIDSPVLLLTAKSDIDDRITGLDSGADDYLTKPFAMGELLARIRQ